MTMTQAAARMPEDDSPYDLFVLAIKSPVTRKKYISNLIYFLDRRSIEPGVAIEERCKKVIDNARQDPEWLTRHFRDFCIESRDRIERKEVRPGWIWNIISALRLFFSVNDFDITKWKKYTRGIPFGRKAADDVIPVREQIVKMAQYLDRRIKPAVYCMASGGFRLGAWEFLQWGHVRPIYIDVNGEEELMAAKVTIYAGEDEQYFCYITPEAYLALKEWMDYRERSGEKITRESWLMRDLWNQRLPSGTDHPAGVKRKSCKNIARVDEPKKLGQQGLVAQISRAWITQGIRGKLQDGKRRHEFAMAHVFRKYFKSTAEGAGMKSINVEIMMGHSIGVSDSYYRPREEELLKDYLKAVPALTFETPSASVQEVQQLKEKEGLHTDAIAAIVEEMQKQKQELETLKAENERLKGRSTLRMLDEIEQMQTKLNEMRRMAANEEDGSNQREGRGVK